MSVVRPRTAVDDAIAAIRQLIASGELMAGQPLRQDELAARFGVSRTPLREAIARLEVEGLVVTEPHRGAVVFRPTTENLREIYEFRLILEPFAVAIVAREHDEAQLDVLEELRIKVEECADWEFARYNSEFHIALCALSGRHRICEAISTLRYQADPYVGMLVGVGGRGRAEDEHGMLLDVIRSRDAESAAELTRHHLQQTVDATLPAVARLHGDAVPEFAAIGADLAGSPSAPASERPPKKASPTRTRTKASRTSSAAATRSTRKARATSKSKAKSAGSSKSSGTSKAPSKRASKQRSETRRKRG